MVSEAEGAAVKGSEDIQVRGFGGEGQRERGERGLAIESGAPEAGAGQEMSEGFQAVRRILVCRAGIRQ
jgi:hypothetical protein